jgi:hypothetical protein
MAAVRFIRISSGPVVVGIALFLWAAASSIAWAQTALLPPLSPRNANYEIDVRLDSETKMLAGRQIVEWRNIQDQPTDELWFHLYWNAWRNDRSTWLLENRSGRRSDRLDDVEQEDLGLDRGRFDPPARARGPRRRSPEPGQPHRRPGRRQSRRPDGDGRFVAARGRTG